MLQTVGMFVIEVSACSLTPASFPYRMTKLSQSYVHFRTLRLKCLTLRPCRSVPVPFFAERRLTYWTGRFWAASVTTVIQHCCVGPCRCSFCSRNRHFVKNTINKRPYSGADKSLARPGRGEKNVSVRMAWISFGALPLQKKKPLDDSSRLHVVEISRVPDMLPGLFPSWSG